MEGCALHLTSNSSYPQPTPGFSFDFVLEGDQARPVSSQLFFGRLQSQDQSRDSKPWGL